MNPAKWGLRENGTKILSQLTHRNNRRKIGLYGGTFDPVHNGHVNVAEQILRQYDLDEIIFIPAARPPHKQQTTASFPHRVAMLERALEGKAGFSISLIEAERTAPSYTIDTLLELGARMAPYEPHLIIGADSFCELHLWYRYDELLSHADFIVAARPSFSFSRLIKAVTRLPGSYEYHEKKRVWEEQHGRKIYYFSGSEVSASSTEIRERLFTGRSVSGLLPPLVFEYIKQSGLYSASFDPDQAFQQ